MQISDMLARMGGFHSIARELGVGDNQVASGRRCVIAGHTGRLQEAGAGSAFRP